jgi:hypothetical protein
VPLNQIATYYRKIKNRLSFISSQTLTCRRIEDH